VAAPNSPKTFYDFLSSFEAGVNGGIEPLLLPKNQLAKGENISVRGAYISHRAPILKRDLIFSSPIDQTTVEQGFFQGAGYYRPDFGVEQLVAQISGHLFSFTLTGDKFTVADVSIAGDLNDANNRQVWMWQAEKWLIISDGTGALPIFYDGVSSRRSAGASTVLCNVTVTSVALPPAIGGSLTATVSPYSGPFNITVLFNGEFYQIYAAPSGTNIQLTNINATSAVVVPSGSQILVNPNFIGITTGIANSTYVSHGGGSVCPGHKWIEWKVTFLLTMQSVGTVAVGDSVTVTTNLGLITCAVSAVTPTTIQIDHYVTIYSSCSSTPGPPPAESVADSELVQFAAPHGPSVVVGTTNANFTNPGLGAIVAASMDVPYTGPANQLVTIGSSQYLLNVATPTPAGAPVTSLTLVNLTDVSTTNYTLPQDILSVPELPAGRMGAYGMGRVAMSLVDGISFIYGDIVGGASGTPSNNYRDAVLKTTELTFNGGTFQLPGSGDIITAMIFPVVLDASLGQGSLQIGTANSMFSSNVPFDSTTWASLQTPILTQSLRGKGPLGQNSTILANSDIIFREFDGLGTLIQARRDFSNSADTGGGNTPISREVSYIFDYDEQDLLSYGSSMTFDNRFLTTISPSISSNGIVHDGLVSMNFDTVSNLRTKLPPVYEGAWIGLNILQVVFGQIIGVKHGFAFATNPTSGKLELHEFLSSQDTATMDLGSIPINWSFDTPIAFNKDIKPINDLIKLTDGEIYTKDISGTVDIEVQYRPDFISAWTSWHRFTIDETTWKPRMGLGLPSQSDCESVSGRPMRVGYFFQFRVIIRGHLKWMGMRVMGTLEQQTNFANPICPEVKVQTLLLDISGGQSSDCVNLIPSGAMYVGNIYTVQLTPNTNYKVIFGGNENVLGVEGGTDIFYAPGTYQFLTAQSGQVVLYSNGNNIQVTATICVVTS
jgi:hypothetical protein